MTNKTKYELTILLMQELSQAQIDETQNSLKQQFENGDATVIKQEYWGSKALVYRINKSKKAHFIYLEVDTPVETLAEIERKMKIDSKFMRHLVIKVDEFVEGETIMMQRRNKELSLLGEKAFEQQDQGFRQQPN